MVALTFSGPVETGMGVHPASWSDTPLSCMEAPAGLGRLPDYHFQLAGGVAGEKGSGAAAAVFPLGGKFTGGAGAFWNGEGENGTLRFASCYVLTGDPVGFMEGLYGPSVALGASVSGDYSRESGDFGFQADCGLQFSLFPSFALGVNCDDLTEDARVRTGFSHVFNRSLEVHASYGSSEWQGGAELSVSPVLKLYAGTDGSSFRGGFSTMLRRWRVSYGGVFLEGSIEHSLGLTRRIP